MNFTTILVEKKEGIAKITLNRPQALNAINRDMLLELETAIEDIEKDDAVRVVVITGSGRAFCAGADLMGIKSLLGQPVQMSQFLRLWRRVFDAIESLSKPVIAQINGMALAGGLELVAVCDMAIASEDAQLGDQHVNFGLVPGGGDSQRLPRLIGIRKAKELLLTGDWISAKEAERIGLINRAAPADKLEEAVNELAKKLCERSPLTSKAIKLLVNKGMQTNLDAGLELELGQILHLFTTEDLAEGVKAFAERRKPVFKGR